MFPRDMAMNFVGLMSVPCLIFCECSAFPPRFAITMCG